MSIIPYANNSVGAEAPTSSSSKTNKGEGKDKEHPTLHTWATRHVWAYGINASRTSKLGVTVVSMGVACVIFRLILGLTLGKREHSPVELFVAALEHQPSGEFDVSREAGGGRTGTMREREMAKVRFVLEEDEREGRVRFVSEKHYTGDFGRKRRTRTRTGEGLLGGVRSWSWGRGGGGGGAEGMAMGQGVGGEYGKVSGAGYGQMPGTGYGHMSGTGYAPMQGYG